MVGLRDEGWYFGVFFEDVSGVLYCFGVERFLFFEVMFWGWLIFVKLELMVVKFFELVVVKFDEICGVLVVGVLDIWMFWLVFLWLFMVVCSVFVVCLVGDLVWRFKGVLIFDCFIGFWVGLGVRGLLYFSFSCW